MNEDDEWRKRLGRLTMEEIQNAVFPFTFTSKAKRKKQVLLAEAAGLQGDLRSKLENAVRVKETGVLPQRSEENEWIKRLNTLTKGELANILRPHGVFARGVSRISKGEMVAEAGRVEGRLKDELMQAVLAKEGDASVRGTGRRRRERVSDEGEGEDQEESEEEEEGEDHQLTTSQRVLRAIERYNPQIDCFMDLPTEEDVRLRHQLYYDATSNEALAQEVCVSCAREMWKKDTEEVLIAELESKEKLVPWKLHPAHVLHEGMLMLCDRLKQTESGLAGSFCSECLRSLAKNRRPRLSLANNMWIGNVPDCMSCLTIPEQLLIALHYPRCFVFKLFPKNGGFRDPDTLQRVMAGNVTTYSMNADAIVEMLEGQLMPRKPELLASVIAVSFIGLGKLPKKWLKGTFRVRRAVVHDALRWLKANNEMYKDVRISQEALRILPEDGIPDAILANVRHEESESLARQESATYVPGDELGDDDVGGPVNGDAGRERVCDDMGEDEDDEDGG